MNQYANSSYLCFCVSCVNVIVEDAVRTVKVRRSSHRKCASIKSPRNFLKKKAANDLLQWPTSPKWHIFAHLLDCSIVPPCTDWGSAAIGLSPREAETWNSLAHALTEFRIGKRILVDDLRSFRRRRSKNPRPWVGKQQHIADFTPEIKYLLRSTGYNPVNYR